MPIPEQITYTSSVANGVTTVFPYTFKIVEEGDIAVELDGVIQTTGFTISGVGDDSGGNVTFSTAPTSGVTVLRYLDPPLQRVTDYQQHGDYSSETLDADLDRIWTVLQARSRDAARSIKVPINDDPDLVVELPSSADRASKFVGFDVDGNVVVADALVGVTAVDSNILSDDGASGSLWTTIRGFISYLRSSLGASIVGFSQSASYTSGSVGAALKTAVEKRAKLSSAITLYVRTDGSDSGTGLVDASGASAPNCAFATWQAAVNAAMLYDNSGYDITISAGAESGTKTWNLTTVDVLGPTVGRGRIKFTGNGANTVINASSNGFYVTGPIQVFFGNLRINSGGAYGSIVVGNGANVFFDTVGPIFGNATGAHLFIHDSTAYLAALNCSYSIVGTAGLAHVLAANNGTCAIEGTAITITGTPNLTAFATVSTGGYIQFSASTTFTGGCTGYRYYAQSGGIIATANQGVNFLPGSVAGVATSGGLYADTNRYGFGSADYSGTVRVGSDLHQIYSSGPNHLTIALANAGTLTGYCGIRYISSTMAFDSGIVGLSSNGNLMITARSDQTGAKGVGAGLPYAAASTSYANDAAAATGGVLVGQVYRNGSQLMVRVA